MMIMLYHSYTVIKSFRRSWNQIRYLGKSQAKHFNCILWKVEKYKEPFIPGFLECIYEIGPWVWFPCNIPIQLGIRCQLNRLLSGWPHLSTIDEKTRSLSIHSVLHSGICLPMCSLFLEWTLLISISFVPYTIAIYLGLWGHIYLILYPHVIDVSNRSGVVWHNLDTFEVLIPTKGFNTI